jgi:hypothetical protein
MKKKRKDRKRKKREDRERTENKGYRTDSERKKG